MNDILPIGTVIKIKNNSKYLFIAGYKGHSSNNADKEYDYIGYTYPEGFLSREKNILFDKDVIENIVYYGYRDDKYEKLCSYLKGGIENNE